PFPDVFRAPVSGPKAIRNAGKAVAAETTRCVRLEVHEDLLHGGRRGDDRMDVCRPDMQGQEQPLAKRAYLEDGGLHGRTPGPVQLERRLNKSTRGAG